MSTSILTHLYEAIIKRIAHKGLENPWRTRCRLMLKLAITKGSSNQKSRVFDITNAKEEFWNHATSWLSYPFLSVVQIFVCVLYVGGNFYGTPHVGNGLRLLFGFRLVLGVCLGVASEVFSQEQHSSMLKSPPCECEVMHRVLISPTRNQHSSSTQTWCTKLKRLCFGCAQLLSIADKRGQKGS